MDKISHIQRYVSDELCHFAGAGKPEIEQYDILVNKILKTRWLTHGPNHDPSVSRGLSIDLSKPISTGEMLMSQFVCFCDIPIPDLTLHVNKYSKFGLSFKKPFLINKGACPVFYIVNDGQVSAKNLFAPRDYLDKINEAKKNGFANRDLYMDTSVRSVIDILAAIDMLCCEKDKEYFKDLSESEFKDRICKLFGLKESQISSMEKAIRGNKQFIVTTRMIIDFLLNYVFVYFKCFDSLLDVKDASNYYMEREWRVADNINFTLNDISRVFFPQKFASRFRADLPEYLGQITFLD